MYFDPKKIYRGLGIRHSIEKRKVTNAGAIARAAVVESQNEETGICQGISELAKHLMRSEFRVDVFMQ